MNEQVQQVIDAVKNATPVIWQAACRQAWIEGIEEFLWMSAFVALICLFLTWRKHLPQLDSFDRPLVRSLLWIGVIGSSALALGCFCFGMSYFLNPTFAAIKDLAELGAKR